MFVIYTILIAWLIGTFLLRVASKCGVEAYLQDRFHVFRYDSELLPLLCVIWPMAIIFGIAAATVYFGAGGLIAAFEFVVDRTVALVCPNTRKP